MAAGLETSPGSFGQAAPPSHASTKAGPSQDSVEHSLVVIVLPGTPRIQAVADQAQHHLHKLHMAHVKRKAGQQTSQAYMGRWQNLGGRRRGRGKAYGALWLAQAQGSAHLRLRQRQVEPLLQALHRHHAALEAGAPAACRRGAHWRMGQGLETVGVAGRHPTTTSRPSTPSHCHTAVLTASVEPSNRQGLPATILVRPARLTSPPPTHPASSPPAAGCGRRACAAPGSPGSSAPATQQGAGQRNRRNTKP